MASESEYGFGIGGNSAARSGGYTGVYVAGGGGGGGGGTYNTATSPLLPAGSPKKKTLEFNALEVSYNYETQELSTVNASGHEISFDAEELLELKAALRLLGLDSSGTVEYR